MKKEATYYRGIYVDEDMRVSFTDPAFYPEAGVYEVDKTPDGRKTIIKPQGIVFWNSIAAVNPLFISRETSAWPDEIKIIKISDKKTRFVFYRYLPLVGKTWHRIMEVFYLNGGINRLKEYINRCVDMHFTGCDENTSNSYCFIKNGRNMDIYFELNGNKKIKAFAISRSVDFAGNMIIKKR